MANVSETNKWLNEEDPDRVKYQSWLTVTPIQGKKFKVKLNRTKFVIQSADRSYFCEKRGIIFLYGFEDFHYELNFLFAESEQQKLQFRVKKGGPAKINNVYCAEAFVQRKDRLQIGYHFLEFSEIADNEGDFKDFLPLNDRAIKSAMPIYLEGETGTGKSFMASKIHEASEFKGRFIHLNLAAISPNLFESELFGHVRGAFTGANNDKKGALLEAHGGTLFLDEINSLSLELQCKLLLVLDSGHFYPVGSTQEKKSQFRLISSSNETLEQLVKEGRIRKDFYFRLISGFTVHLPKVTSSELYFNQVLDQLEKEMDIFIPSHLKRFYGQLTWEGNIRELKQYLAKKKVQQGGKLSLDVMDEELFEKRERKNSAVPLSYEEVKPLDEFKRDYIKLMYQRAGANVLHTARILKVAPGTVRAAIR